MVHKDGSNFFGNSLTGFRLAKSEFPAHKMNNLLFLSKIQLLGFDM